MGGGVGRGVDDFACSFPFLIFRKASGRRGWVGTFLRDDDTMGLRGTRGGRAMGWEGGAVALTARCKGAGGVTGSSATRWEPGSARVPTFCAVPLGKASSEGDLPLGDGGGEPNRESSSPVGGDWDLCDIALFDTEFDG